MATRWWRSERGLRVVDTNGRPVDVVVGLVRNQRGRWRRAVGIGDGPSALLTVPEMTELIRALEQSTEDLNRIEAGR